MIQIRNLCILLFFGFKFIFGQKPVQTTTLTPANGFSITNFIQSYGYTVEAHENIQTEDGYLLDMYRIPTGKQNEENTGAVKPVVLLMHGLLASAECWVISGPEKGLAFLLADKGYDVWMGNARGSIHSRKHVTLDSRNRDFWQFSWHEIGIYDLPAKINYILEKTGQEKMHYIGHSQGTTAFFVMASEKPEYNAQIKLMVALAPVAYMSRIPHPAVRLMTLFNSGLNIFSNVIGSSEFVPNNEILNLAGAALCQAQVVIQEICANIIFLATGYDSQQLERSLVPLIAQTNPAGASTKQFFHYGQGIRSGEFRQYDYGLFNNMDRYNGSSIPPSYNLASITAPVALFYSNNDWLVSIQDVERLTRELPNVILQYLVPYESFNHLDFLFAKDVVNLLYVKVFEILGKYL